MKKPTTLLVIVLVLTALFAAGLWISEKTGFRQDAQMASSSSSSLSPSSTPTIASSSGAQSPATSTATAPAGNVLSFGAQDNERTIAVTPGSRIAIELPSAIYNRNSLYIVPSDTMKEIKSAPTATAAAPIGSWSRTFETLHAGTTTIIVAPMNASTSPYTLNVRIVSGNDAWENGMTIITQDNRNASVHLGLHERFLIQLGDSFSWSVGFTPSSSITRVPHSTTASGFQGVYETEQAGAVALHAEGRPLCSSNGPCPQFIIAFDAALAVN